MKGAKTPKSGMEKIPDHTKGTFDINTEFLTLKLKAFDVVTGS
jgi:hypothetical protein